MVVYTCQKCNKNFKQKSHWDSHVKNKKHPCVEYLPKIISGAAPEPGSSESKVLKKDITCQYCKKVFKYNKNLNRHIGEHRCEILKLQKQQKENIFVSLLNVEKINNDANQEINKLNDDTDIKKLIDEMKEMKEQIKNQKKEFEKMSKNYEDTEKIMKQKYKNLENNNIKLQKTNHKLQNKIENIVNKNNININNINNNNTNNGIIINNPTIKLVDFGKEDLDKMSYLVFIDAIKSQGLGLFNKTIEGIHFNKDYPENHNIYISDINREKVMVYKNEKWLLDNWNTIFNNLLEKVIKFGYDKDEFLRDCDFTVENIKYNKEMIKKSMKWFKLLDDYQPDIEYFELDIDDRPKISEELQKEYEEMYQFRKKHPKKETENILKNRVKINLYNKKSIPINTFKNLINNTDCKLIKN
jgi:hypothetical protein